MKKIKSIQPIRLRKRNSKKQNQNTFCPFYSKEKLANSEANNYKIKQGLYRFYVPVKLYTYILSLQGALKNTATIKEIWQSKGKKPTKNPTA